MSEKFPLFRSKRKGNLKETARVAWGTLNRHRLILKRAFVQKAFDLTKIFDRNCAIETAFYVNPHFS